MSVGNLPDPLEVVKADLLARVCVVEDQNLKDLGLLPEVEVVPETTQVFVGSRSTATSHGPAT